MGAYATALPRRRAPSTPTHAERARRAVGVPGARRARAHRPGDGRGGRRAGELDVLWTLGRQLPRGAARSARRRGRARPGAAARPPGRRAHHRRCSSRATTCSCCPWPPATSRRAAAPRPPPSGGSSSAPRSRARWARRAASGGSSPTSRRGCARARGRVRVGRQPGAAGRRSRRSCRPTPASSAWRPPATRCSGAAGTSAPAARSRCRTAGVGSPPLDADRATTLPDGAFTVATRRGKQFNSMVHARGRPAHRRRPATPCTSTRPTPRALGARRRRPGAAAQRGRHVRRPPQGRAPPGRARSRCTGPRATC